MSSRAAYAPQKARKRPAAPGKDARGKPRAQQGSLEASRAVDTSSEQGAGVPVRGQDGSVSPTVQRRQSTVNCAFGGGGVRPLWKTTLCSRGKHPESSVSCQQETRLSGRCAVRNGRPLGLAPIAESDLRDHAVRLIGHTRPGFVPHEPRDACRSEHQAHDALANRRQRRTKIVGTDRVHEAVPPEGLGELLHPDTPGPRTQRQDRQRRNAPFPARARCRQPALWPNAACTASSAPGSTPRRSGCPDPPSAPGFRKRERQPG